MSESAGSAAIEHQNRIQSSFNKDYMRKIAREEIRKNELEEKLANDGLTKKEAAELASIKLGAALDTIATMGSGTICYMA